MRIEVVTLFPALVEAGLAAGILGRALREGRLQVGLESPRSHADDPHRTVDDRPFGGGPGMVLKAEPLARALATARSRLADDAPVIGLTAQGARFDQAAARRLAGLAGFGLVAGRYEGIDERVVDAMIDEELSIGDYVLSGGELPALVVIDAVARLLPGVLGDAESAAEDSFGDGLLDWPHFTRPEIWEGRPVPPVLLGGNHAAIRRWRLMQALGRTWQKRPDLLERRPLSPEERALLEEYCRAAGVEPPRQVQNLDSDG
jgi:tRNA (guanine37-N1)-methyltransferase